jgi:hypothetical protein
MDGSDRSQHKPPKGELLPSAAHFLGVTTAWDPAGRQRILPLPTPVAGTDTAAPRAAPDGGVMVDFKRRALAPGV